MPRPLRLSLLLLCALAASMAAAAELRETHRYGIYLLNSRIGSLVSRTYDDRFENEPCVRMEAESDVRLKALGSEVEQKIRIQYHSSKQGRPLQSRFTMISAGRTTHVLSRYHPDRVVSEVDAGGQKSTKTVAIPKGVVLVDDPQLSAGANRVQFSVGRKWVSHFFDPASLTVQKIDTEVLREDRRAVAGKPVTAYLVRTVNSVTGTSESWLDREGRLLEDDSRIGIRVVREDVEPLAPFAGAGGKGADFAETTSVKTALRIPEPRKVGTLRLKISGLPDENVILSDLRQKVVERQKLDKGGENSFSAVYQVASRALPAVSLPLARPGADEAFLGDAAYLGLEEPMIRRQALELAAGAGDRLTLARRLRAWVNRHMQKPTNIGTPRSAAEILRSREGVCRDYATLFAALGRAAGLPTRLCTGMLYQNDGFYYHAWVECRLTDEPDGWYAFDPTLETDVVDATHIKFAQGDPVDMFAGIRVIGRIRAEVVEYQLSVR